MLASASQLENDFGLRLDWGLGLCEALLGWVLIAAAVAGRAFGLFWTEDPPPLLRVLAGAVPPPCIVFGSVVGWGARCIAFVFCASGGGALSRM